MKDKKSLLLSAALLVLALAGLALPVVDLHDTALADGYAQCRAEVAPELKRLAEQDAALDEIEDQLILYAIFGKEMPTEAEYRKAKEAAQ